MRTRTLTSQKVQSDEADMQMTYKELSRFGTLRKVHHLGPYGMFLRLQEEWGADGTLSPREIAHKVRFVQEASPWLTADTGCR
jgi:NAD+ synthase (glutamine-hydrolysing)